MLFGMMGGGKDNDDEVVASVGDKEASVFRILFCFVFNLLKQA